MRTVLRLNQSQQRASSATDASIMTKLKTNASLREAQRLNRLDSPHANAWISARPSNMHGTDTILPPRIDRTVARLLGHLCSDPRIGVRGIKAIQPLGLTQISMMEAVAEEALC